MKKLFKNRKGMTMVEVLISIAVLALLSVPIMVTFMNAQVLARKVDKQTEISAITRTVKQIVTDGISKGYPMEGIGGADVDLTPGDGVDDDNTYLDFITKLVDFGYCNADDLRIMENTTESNKYKFSIMSRSEFNSTNFEDVYNILITIKEIGSDRKVNELKVAVRR